MMPYHSKLKVIALFGLSLFYMGVYGQDYPVTGMDTVVTNTSDSIFNALEKRHTIRFFYNNSVLNVQRLPLDLIDLPLEEVLSRLELLTRCFVVHVNQNAYVLMPAGDRIYQRNSDNGIIEIGNPNEYGRYRTATMSGTLSDGKTGEPLTGAVISIKKLNIIATTDGHGNFSIEAPAGEHELEFSYFGYERSMQKIKLVSNGKADFEIFEKPANIDAVIVRAEKSESNLSQVSMSPIRLNSRTIKELPVTLGGKDILRSMTLLPGIQSVGEFGTGFNVRGGSSDQNLILLEETPLFNASHLFGLESIINPDAVSGLVLLKAGMPAEYGERVSSVTSIRLGNKPDALHVKGGIGLFSSRLSLETPVFMKKANLLLGGRTSYSNWLLHKIPDAELKNSKAGFYDLNFLFNVNVNDNNKFTLFGYAAGDKFTYNKTELYDYRSTLGTFRWLHSFNSRLSSKLLSGYSRYDYHFTSHNSNLPSNAYQISSTLIYNSLKYCLLWNINGKYSFDFGLDAILYRSSPGNKKPYGDQSNIVPVLIDSEKGMEGAAYVSGNIKLSDKLGGEIGMRYSGFALLGPGVVYHYSSGESKSTQTITDTVRKTGNVIIKHFKNLEPRISLRYLINEQSSVKLSFTRINQYINLLSNTAVAIPSDIWKLSSPYIRPLLSDQFAMGYYRNFKQNVFETSVELYYKTLRNIPEYRDGAQLLLNRTLETELLEASGYNYGIELYARKNAGKLTGWISYTWSVSKRHTSSPFINDQINHNRYFPSNYDKPHSLNIVGNYYLTRRWHASVSFSYSTGRPVTLPESKFTYGDDWLVRYSSRNAYRLPDYHRLDLSISCNESLRITKRLKGSWTFSVINVYGRKNAYSSFFKKTESDYSNNYKPYSLYTLYIIGRPLPTITYNFSF